MNTRTETTSPGGYTLVEMVLTISILGIVGMVTAFVLVESMKVYARTGPALDASYHARHATARMTRDIRDMADTSSITTFTSTALTFDDRAGNTLDYDLSEGNLLRNGDLLAKGVTSLAFTYWKSDGTAATVAADLYLVEIDLTVQTATQPYRLRVLVFPRNLGPGA